MPLKWGGIPEYITEHEGYLVEPGNVDSLVKGIEHAIERITMKGFDTHKMRIKAQRDFDIKKYIERIEKLYSEAMGLV